MNCTAPPRSSAPVVARYGQIGFSMEPQPGPSWMEDNSSRERHQAMASDPSHGRSISQPTRPSSKGNGASKSNPSTMATTSTSTALSITSPAMARRPSTNVSSDRSIQRIQTRVQASKSTSKLILDDQQTGYLAVVPPDMEKDLMKYTTPALDGTIGPRPIKASMLFEFDYRPKISSLLPHESHKEISAHLNIAWKSIGNDILQLYKDLARKVEQKLRALSGEGVGVRAVQKRKAAAANKRTSREPPPNSGLRRCNCRPDCPKYKIISGSDLEKEWLAKFRGGVRNKSIVVETVESGSDIGNPSSAGAAAPIRTPPTTTPAGPRLFGDRLTPASTIVSLPNRDQLIRDQNSDELPDPLPHHSHFSPYDEPLPQPQDSVTRQQPASPQSELPDIVAALGNTPSEPSDPPLPSPTVNIAHAAAAAANVGQHFVQAADPSNVYYMPQFGQNFVYPMQLPFVDPTYAVAQFQGCNIYQDGTIFNANGEPFAITLPPSQFAHIAPQTVAATDAASANPSDEENRRDAASAAPTADLIADAFEHATDDNGGTYAVALNEEGEVLIQQKRLENDDDGIAFLETEMHVETIQDVDHNQAQLDIASSPASIVVGLEATPIQSPSERACPSSSAEVSPVAQRVQADADQTLTPTTERESEEENQPTTFTWHQVQAAEGREVPAKEIGWTWNNKKTTASDTSLQDRRDEKDRKEEKEKSFALQANLSGVETDRKEFEDVKMMDETKDREIPLDPRQLRSMEEVEKKAELKGEDEAKNDDDDDEEEKEEGECDDDDDDDDYDMEETIAVEEKGRSEEDDLVSPLECIPGMDVNVVQLGTHDSSAVEIEDGEMQVEPSTMGMGLADFLEEEHRAP